MPVPAARFATTRWSVVHAAGPATAEGRAALAWLAERAWGPLVAHVQRRGWPGQDAEDLVQSFLARLIERGDVASADRSRGRFRTWLLTCLDHFLASTAEAARAQKRGGGLGQAALNPELAVADARTADPALVAQRAWDRDWALDLLAGALRQVEQEHAASPELRLRWATLSPFLASPGDGAAYARAGAALGLGEGAVKVAVHRLRARCKGALRQAVAETLAEPEDVVVDAELRDLIAALGG